MKIKKRFLALLSALALLLAMHGAAYAHETPDSSRTGSISVAMSYNGKAVAGGSLSLYQVGAVTEKNGSYGFTLTKAFAGSGVFLEDISSGTLASDLAAYAAAKKVSAAAKADIGNDGTVTVKDLTIGLYLVVQSEAAYGYEAVSPFLISVPMNEGGAYVYDVDAAPKLSVLKETSDTPYTPPTPAETPDKPEAPRLPQTGQMNWPVPVMVVLGLCLLLLGFALRYREPVSEGIAGNDDAGKKGMYYET